LIVTRNLRVAIVCVLLFASISRVEAQNVRAVVLEACCDTVALGNTFRFISHLSTAFSLPIVSSSQGVDR